MEYYLYKGEDELYHWGIKGMRWGVRRYQRKDGSLTPAGQRRLKRETEAVKKEEQVLKNRKSVKSKFDKLAARKKAVEEGKKELDGDDPKKAKKTDDAPKKKSVKDMTDEELAYHIRRIQLEKQYESLVTEPEPVAKGNSFVKDFINKSAVPAIQEAGKSLIKDSLLKMGKKYLGLETQDTEDYVTKLGKEVKKMTLEKQYKKLKEEAAAEVNKTQEKASNAETKTESARKVFRATRKAKEGTVEDNRTTWNYDKAEKWASDTYSNKKNSSTSWRDVDTSHTSSGKDYVSDFLSLPAPRMLALPAPKDDD